MRAGWKISARFLFIPQLTCLKQASCLGDPVSQHISRDVRGESFSPLALCGCCFMGASRSCVRLCWMMRIRCMPRSRGKWSRGMTGLRFYANGIRYLEKAPLLYWSMAASFQRLWARGLGGTAASGDLYACSFRNGLPRWSSLLQFCDRRVLCGTDPDYFVWDFHLQPYPPSRCDRVLVA